MSSRLHPQFIRVRQFVAATAAGLVIGSAGVACATAIDHRQAPAGAIAAPTVLGPSATPPGTRRVGATSLASSTRMRELEARGYVPIKCLIDGTLLINPHTHRTAKVLS
jgi:hypothetical protein